MIVGLQSVGGPIVGGTLLIRVPGPIGVSRPDIAPSPTDPYLLCILKRDDCLFDRNSICRPGRGARHSEKADANGSCCQRNDCLHNSASSAIFRPQQCAENALLAPDSSG